MKTEEIVKALRCVSTAGGAHGCEHCPYWKEEEVPEEERPVYGADTWHSCDVDRVGLDGAALAEKLLDRCARYAEEIAVLQEKLRWIPVEERLPEVGERVIVARGGKSEQGVYLGVNGWWKVYGANTKKVTHWMPLPAGPEVDGHVD